MRLKRRPPVTIIRAVKLENIGCWALWLHGNTTSFVLRCIYVINFDVILLISGRPWRKTSESRYQTNFRTLHKSSKCRDKEDTLRQEGYRTKETIWSNTRDSISAKVYLKSAWDKKNCSAKFNRILAHFSLWACWTTWLYSGKLIDDSIHFSLFSLLLFNKWKAVSMWYMTKSLH